jgi:hypothetical protein
MALTELRGKGALHPKSINHVPDTQIGIISCLIGNLKLLNILLNFGSFISDTFPFWEIA